MNVYEIITQRIIEQLEKGTVPWRKPWNTLDDYPRNLQSGHKYRGINVFLLNALGYESPYFLTFRQAQERGGRVRAGQKGCPIVFWKWNWQPKSPQEQSNDSTDATTPNVPVLRYYTVFNVAQCEGIEAPATIQTERMHEPLKAAEDIVSSMPYAPAMEWGGRQACYSPSLDRVSMPRPELFVSQSAYYATLFHELVHSTGHSSRLDRKLDKLLLPFGSADYSREELVAEMGAAFLCGAAGILDARIDQSAAYIKGWLERLRDDPRLVVIAAAQAQKAADFITRGGIDAPLSE